MGIVYNTSVVRGGLVLHLDAANKKSYVGTGTAWKDLSGNNKNFTIDSTNVAYNALGYFSLTDAGFSINSNITTSTTSTCVYWIKTTDVQSLFLHRTDVDGYLGAYRSDNKFYNSNAGTPTFHMDGIQYSNIYDNILDGKWHMVEFKNVNISTWQTAAFSKYNSYSFSSTNISNISIYNRNLTTQESLQNFNGLRGRYGI